MSAYVPPGGPTSAHVPSGGSTSAHVPPGGTAYLPAAGGEGTMRLPGPPFPGGPSGGQGPPGPAGGPPEPKSRKPLIIGAVAALAVVVVGGVALAGLGGSGDDGQAAPPPSAPATHRPVRPHAPTPKPSRTPSHRPTAKQMKHNPYTPQRVCGKGYRVIGTHALGEASTYLLYNKHTGANCVVTMVPRSPGKVFLSASLVVKGGGRENRSGNVPFYAGPIRLPARGKCVMWGGASKTARWTSGWSHCGK